GRPQGRVQEAHPARLVHLRPRRPRDSQDSGWVQPQRAQVHHGPLHRASLPGRHAPDKDVDRPCRVAQGPGQGHLPGPGQGAQPGRHQRRLCLPLGQSRSIWPSEQVV
ncbi:hypothetical protein CPC16_011976, partial [Podila verticillata]